MTSRNLESKEITWFFLIFAFLFGITVRIFPLLKAEFPLVDGGMFYAMVQDLQASHFALPVFTTYNQANIPFAYPPLAFYITGCINSLTHFNLISIIKWQPVATNLLIIPLFFLLAKQILRSENKAALSTLIFSLTPNSYWWEIVGGGLTRALGALFFLLIAICADQMYQTRKPIWIVATTIAGALAILSHPGWALQSMTVIFLFWLFHGRDRQGILISISIGLGMALLTSPWWISVIQRHGLDVFLQASQVTESRWLFWTIPLTMGFTGEYNPVIAVLAMCGLFIHAAKKDFLLPAWALLSLFIDPRGGVPASVFSFSIMAATALSDGIASRLAPANIENQNNAWTSTLNITVGRFFWGTFILVFFYGAFQVSSTLSHQSLSIEEMRSIRWVLENTASQDRFLILDWQDNPLLSPLIEWFPALANRRSITTVQGSEWLAGESGYNQQIALNRSIHQCLYQEVDCLSNSHYKYDFILFSITNTNGDYRSNSLLLSLGESDKFTLVYATSGINIFKVNK